MVSGRGFRFLSRSALRLAKRIEEGEKKTRLRDFAAFGAMF